MDELTRLLADQRGIATHAQLLAAGVTPARLLGAVRRQEVVRLFHGVYGIPPFEEEWAVTVARGALLYAGRASAVTHLTRLGLAGLWIDPAEPTHVAVERPRSVRSGVGITVHEVERLVATAVDGLLVVPIATALSSVWSTTPRRGDRRAIVCDVLGRGLTSTDEVRRTAARTLRRRAELLDTCAMVALGCESPREIDYLVDVERAFRLPVAQRQVTIRGRGFRHRVDVLYEAEKLIVEVDGRYHDDPAQALADARRDADLRSLGYRVLRITGEDLRHPARVAAMVRRLLAVSA